MFHTSFAAVYNPAFVSEQHHLYLQYEQQHCASSAETSFLNGPVDQTFALTPDPLAPYCTPEQLDCPHHPTLILFFPLAGFAPQLFFPCWGYIGGELGMC
jgi:hypothetical protein